MVITWGDAGLLLGSIVLRLRGARDLVVPPPRRDLAARRRLGEVH
jgi:hypothetical protein